MAEKIDVEKLAKQNPAVDLKELRRAEEALRLLREQGISGPAFEIVQPYDRRPARKHGRNP